MQNGALSRSLPLLLLSLMCIVHWPQGQSSAHAQAQRGNAKETPKSNAIQPARPAAAEKTLPGPVAEMREAILTAVRSGIIEDLRAAIEWNELKPDIAPALADDPVAFLKQQSADGEGREILAILGNLLDGPYAIVPAGKDIENNRVFVWPSLAELPFAALTPAQEVDLLRLVSASAAREMKSKGRYGFWRVMIGADGTWHSFRKVE